MRVKRLREEQLRELVGAYHQPGETTCALAERFGIHCFNVSDHLNRAGVARRSR